MKETLRILLLEDSPDDALLNEHVLRREGLEFGSMRVYTQKAFLGALESFAPDIVLADYNLPGYDGLQALEQVRELNPELPFIFVTGAMGEERAVESLKKGADDYIIKDRIGRLPQAVRRTLREREYQRNLKKLETEKRLSEERYLEASNRIRDAFVLTDGAGGVLEWNPAAERMFGHARNDAIGRKLAELIVRERDAASLQAVVMQENAEEAVDRSDRILEIEAKHRDGREFPVELALSCMETGGGAHAIALLRDITDRKRNELALQRSEAEMQSIFLASPVGIGVVSILDRTLLNVNQRLCEMLGYSRKELVGRNAKVLYPTEEEYEAVRRDECRQMAIKGVGTVETRFRCRDGPIIHVMLSSALLDPEDESSGATFAALDISDKKRHEASLALEAQRAGALLELPDLSEGLDEREFVQRGLELAEELTGSEISFLHFVRNDEQEIELAAWSRNISDELTSVFEGHCPVGDTGVWADALRQRDAVVFNDYPASGDGKGLRGGHPELHRLISTPVIDDGKIVMLAGVGNKADDYDDVDATTLQLISCEIWRTVQRRRNLAELSDSEARYRELVDNMSDGVVLFYAEEDGGDFLFREINRAGERICRLPRERIIGRRVTEVLPGVRDMGLLEVLQRVRKTGQAESLLSHLYRDDRLHLWTNSYVYRLPSGELVLVFSDISERKQAEDAVRDSETRLRTLIDTSPDLIWMKDADGVYLKCNTRFEQFFGASEADIVGKTDYDFVDRETADSFRKHDLRAMNAGGPAVNEEEITFASDGHKEQLETIKAAVYLNDGTLAGILGVARDITERKRAEVDLAAQVMELRRWHEVTLDREMRGLELKQEVNDLLAEQGRPLRYPEAENSGNGVSKT